MQAVCIEHHLIRDAVCALAIYQNGIDKRTVLRIRKQAVDLLAREIHGPNGSKEIEQVHANRLGSTQQVDDKELAPKMQQLGPIRLDETGIRPVFYNGVEDPQMIIEPEMSILRARTHKRTLAVKPVEIQLIGNEDGL